MRSDIDALLEENCLDALWVTGSMTRNADMVYFTGPQEVSSADLFKMTGRPPVVFHATSMDREEAAKSNLETHALDSDYPLDGYLRNHHGNMVSAMAERYRDVFQAIGFIKGRMAVSGMTAINTFLALLNALKPILPDIEFTSFFKDSPIQQARMTKSPDEAARIRQMGQITTEVVSRVADFLTSQKVFDDHLIGDDGSPVTISSVKKRINLWLAELGVENPEETIFAIGRDAGIPHSAGNPENLIELGKPIVFDIYPCEKGGGYFYDFTRTWCLGHAPEAVQELHEQVAQVYQEIVSSLEKNVIFKIFQEKTCTLFSQLGHETIADKPGLTEGYIHSIGHGLGLDVHENPFSGMTATETDLLKPGAVFTIEPGLYYPSKSMGVRIEDTLYLNPEGQFETLADYPYNLVLPIKRK